MTPHTKKEENKNWGKSRCCKAEIDYSGGGYDGEDIVLVKVVCKGCGENNPEVIQRIGRPLKELSF